MTPLDNLRRIVAGWRGEWRVDAHAGVTLSHDGDEWPIASMDGDVMIALVELLNAIRPAVDGATAEIARLTAELAAARAVPPDVEEAIDARDAEWQNRIATFHQGFDGDGCESGDPIDWTLSALSQAKCTVEDAVGDFIEGHAKRLCDAAGGVWHDEYDSWSSQVHDVLNHLRADADGTVLDGRASQPATVGGLLATGIADDVRAWCVECDVDILTDGESGDRCDWLTFVRGEQDANDERDRAIERLVEEGHAADVDAAEKMVRVVPLVPVRGPIVEVPDVR